MRLPIAGKIITLVVVAVALSCTAVLLTTMRLLEPWLRPWRGVIMPLPPRSAKN